MFVHRSNRAEELIDVLAQVVREPPPSPTARECIVVQGHGMERWLSMELARRLGVWANPDFPFPRAIIDRAIGAVLGGDDAGQDLFEPETMMWAVVALLPEHLDRAEFTALRSYLHGDDRGTKLVQLAYRIASTFDHYAVYRPEMVLGWEGEQAPAGSDWQPILWRALVARHGNGHIAARAQRFLAAAANGGRPAEGFPHRISLFGVSTLPPLYLQVLVALSRVVELRLFLLSPSREYWGQIRSQRELIRARRRLGGEADQGTDLHFEEGNPLLASLGRLGRDFQEVLEELADYQETELDLYRDPGQGSMLAAIQSDILHLRHRGRGQTAPPLPLDGDDRSIMVHACHGPMREVEVLHDQLLAAFEEDDSLKPRDIVVMTPAIETYAPFIEAVFGAGGDGRPRIPYRIADRSVQRTDEIVEAYLHLLATLPGRLTAPDVLDLLGIEVIRQRFGITGEEINVLRRWIGEAGIRWGEDGAHREELGLPAFEENTWRFGLDRLLLGYAMPGEERHLYCGVLPYDDMEGTRTEILGRLAEFMDNLFRFRRVLRQQHWPEEWQVHLTALLDAMCFRDGSTDGQHRRVQAVLDSLRDRTGRAGFRGKLPLDTVRVQIERDLQRGTWSGGFLSGGVTFCQMMPMRSIPFRFVCLMGMNDGAFPRARHPLGFDKIAERPLTGDRSQRDDDRYLFLEALVSARQRLLVTYVGQSIRDDGERPPSVVLSELLDTLAESFQAPSGASDDEGATRSAESGGDAVRRHVLVRHSLQPFSRRYFGGDDDPRLFSYDLAHFHAASALGSAREIRAPFFVAALARDEEKPDVALDDLLRFYRSPSRFLLQRRLGLYLERNLAPLEIREPMDLDQLERWKMGNRLLGLVLNGESPDEFFASFRASGAVPPGVPGRCIYDDIKPKAVRVAMAALRWKSAPRTPTVVIDIEVDGSRVTGQLRDVWATGQLYSQFSRVGGDSEIGLWIRHVLLQTALPAATDPVSRLIGRPQKGRAQTGDGVGTVRFRPVDDPLAILRELLALYRAGQTIPLPFFPKTSRSYAEAWLASGDTTRALEKARAAFRGNSQSGHDGESDDVYVRQIYGQSDPLSETPPGGVTTSATTFSDTAIRVYAPLLQHREAEAG